MDIVHEDSTKDLWKQLSCKNEMIAFLLAMFWE